MRRLSGKFSPAKGIVMSLACLPPGTWAQGTKLTPCVFDALLDTGASNTCISPKVASDVGLVTTGMLPMASATQIIPVYTYLMDAGIVSGTDTWWQFTNLDVLEFQPAAGAPYEILIGRDVICKGVLTMSFDGHYTFSI
jgi:hypothetical protein